MLFVIQLCKYNWIYLLHYNNLHFLRIASITFSSLLYTLNVYNQSFVNYFSINLKRCLSLNIKLKSKWKTNENSFI
nr:MAG TPA: hypothetical protein [Caudoviricetes sp.]